GAVARTVEAACPIRAEIRGSDLEARQRRAAEVRADALHDEDARPNATELVLRVIGLLGLLRRRVRELRLDALQLLEHALGAMHDEDRTAAPFDSEHAAGLDLADVDLDRRTERLRAGARPEGRDERNCRADESDGARHG